MRISLKEIAAAGLGALALAGMAAAPAAAGSRDCKYVNCYPNGQGYSGYYGGSAADVARPAPAPQSQPGGIRPETGIYSPSGHGWEY